MTERVNELRAILAEVRARWQRQALLRAWMLGAFTAAALLLVGVLTVWLIASQGVPLVIVVAAVLAVVLASLAFSLWPLRQPPSDRRLPASSKSAGGWTVLVTAVDKGADSPRSPASSSPTRCAPPAKRPSTA
jgi:hypothetical protein